ncbi:MAG: hypothetical protein RBU35_17195 [Anaerolineae bacterium]|jgi:hypothetical protein|nr:hypothetical protein [Anaerolineae bacterium]
MMETRNARADDSDKRALIKRLRYLWTGELFNVFYLPAMALLVARSLGEAPGLFAIYSAARAVWLLLQGAAYWLLKLRAVKTDSDIEGKHLRWFAAFKRMNWALIALLPALLAIKALVDTPFRSSVDVVIGLGFYVLAVLEQVNYYHYQLMYHYRSDLRRLRREKRLKRSSLYRALERLDQRASWLK